MPKLILLGFCILAIVSGLYNTTGVSLIKSTIRWFQFFCLYTVFKSEYFQINIRSKAFLHFFIAPFILMFIFSLVQFFVYGPEWLNIMSDDLGKILYGVSEVASRIEQNNYIYKVSSIRAMGVYISPPDLAFVCGMILITIFYNKASIVYKIVLGGAVFTVMLLTMGRSGFLYMLVSLTMVNIIYKKQYYFILYTALGLILAMIIPEVRERLLMLLVPGAELERVLIWETMINMWQSSPILGVGGGQIPHLFNNFAAVDWLINRQAVSHSAYFGILAEYGVVGISLYIPLLFFIFKKAVNSTSKLDTNYKCMQICLTFYTGMLSISADLYQAGNTAFVLFLIFIALTNKYLSR